MRLTTPYIKSDLLSGMVVFLVALPLCLGIALASGAPLFSGIISGVIGGIVVGWLSQSHVSVSGPAAGLTAIILTAIQTLGSFELFLTAVVLAGLFQLALGLLQAGSISNFFPSNVIEGMLTGIGIIIILKQLPHAVGYDADATTNFAFLEDSSKNSLTAIQTAFSSIEPGAMLIAATSFGILVAFQHLPQLRKLRVLPGGLVAVVAGVLLNEIFIGTGSAIALHNEHLVQLPVATSWSNLMAEMQYPSIKGLLNKQVWMLALTIAAVASLESLLSLEASVKMDPYKRFASSNAELKAQGIGNILSGLVGGMPMTSVIVRSTANIDSGARTKRSAIFHGILLLVAFLFIPVVLNKIPLATLAVILIHIGYKLASPKVFRHMWRSGYAQFIPFMATIIAVVFTDLLKGVGIGFAVSVLFILRGNMQLAYFFHKEEHHEGARIRIKLAQEVSFLNKAAIKQTLAHLPQNSRIVIDASETVYIDHDVLELIRDFSSSGAADKNITVDLTGFRHEYRIENTQQHVADDVSNKPASSKSSFT